MRIAGIIIGVFSIARGLGPSALAQLVYDIATGRDPVGAAPWEP